MVFVLVVALMVVFLAPANAYVDAGSGSYMIQMGLAGLLAAIFSVKLAWQRIKAWAMRPFSSRGQKPSVQA